MPNLFKTICWYTLATGLFLAANAQDVKPSLQKTDGAIPLREDLVSPIIRTSVFEPSWNINQEIKKTGQTEEDYQRACNQIDTMKEDFKVYAKCSAEANASFSAKGFRGDASIHVEGGAEAEARWSKDKTRTMQTNFSEISKRYSEEIYKNLHFSVRVKIENCSDKPLFLLKPQSPDGSKSQASLPLYYSGFFVMDAPLESDEGTIEGGEWRDYEFKAQLNTHARRKILQNPFETSINFPSAKAVLSSEPDGTGINELNSIMVHFPNRKP